MPRILLTAFRPFDDWDENASWLALQSLMRDLPPSAEVTTRLYPVDYDELRPRLAMDLQTPYDAVLHVGQASGAAAIRLEQFALNACRRRGDRSETLGELEANGPAAYRSRLPLGDWTRRLRESGVPCELSLHAGDYLCNAALYWSHHLLESMGREANVAFVHVPLDLSQAVAAGRDTASLPSEVSACALRLMIEWVHETTRRGEPLVATTTPTNGRGEA